MRGYDDKTGTFGRTGDFWYEMTEPETRRTARHMAHSSLLSGAAFSLDLGAGGLTGGGWVYSANFDLPWLPRDVAVIGADLQERVVTAFGEGSSHRYYVIRRPLEASRPGFGDVLVLLPEDGAETFVLKTAECEYILLPVEGEDPEAISADDLQVKWAVPIPPGCRPAAIDAGGRQLVVGIDFVLQRNALVFREDPNPIFDPCGRIHVLGGWRKQGFLLDYTLQVDHLSPSQNLVANFYRNVQTASALRGALAEVAGRYVMEEGKEVVGVRPWCDAVVYDFSDGTQVEVDYPHDRLSTGDWFPAGTILGGGIRVEGGRQGRSHWWREFDFPNGLDSAWITPFEGLTIPDAPTRFEAYDTTDGKLHVRPFLPGDPEVLVDYWHWIREAEISSGRFINDILGLASEGDDTYRNGVDFYFENGLGEHAVIVELDKRVLGSRMVSDLRRFAEREKMHNAVLIVLDVSSS